MYEIVLFTGGPYKFEEFQEYVEDVGGLVLKKDRFDIIRGEYFLCEEIRALTVLPGEEKKQAKKLAKEIKGNLEELDVDEDDQRKILLCIILHGSLSRYHEWADRGEIEDELTCPCEIRICSDTIECFKDTPEVLEAMVEMELLEKRDNKGTVEYRIRD